ncbi:methyltransferase domain-containing protein [Texcoconibacillus texcoconensis]|uniref:Ubiquinone/menaquinone biosynthesis C-methylase UbiE n=1 Tax=Texcoconibacillus texcoconensis TaxID=1095777 RepID=A0A840QS80_9BACI|nr:ubiquinone/menaquinone biosynthesis C-methylase UbiE [Texcoconibacillus texcoconensis]
MPLKKGEFVIIPSYEHTIAKLGVTYAHPGGKQCSERILNTHPLTKDQYVLNAGCGSGDISAWLVEKFSVNVIAVDRQAAYIEKAKLKHNHNNLSFEHADLFYTSFPKATFDVIISESVTFFNPIDQLLSRYYNWLKPGGVLYHQELVKEDDHLTTDEKQELCQFYGWHDILSEHEWIVALANAGFSSVSVEERASLINRQQSQSPSSFAVSFDENMSEGEFQLLEKHQELSDRYAFTLGDRYFRSVKGAN